jgi:hypothetical protein
MKKWKTGEKHPRKISESAESRICVKPPVQVGGFYFTTRKPHPAVSRSDAAVTVMHEPAFLSVSRSATAEGGHCAIEAPSGRADNYSTGGRL